jgi:hypothetical protein
MPSKNGVILDDCLPSAPPLEVASAGTVIENQFPFCHTLKQDAD